MPPRRVIEVHSSLNPDERRAAEESSMNAVLKSAKLVKAQSIVNTESDFITVRAPDLSAMSRWAVTKYDALAEQAAADKDADKRYRAISVSVFALALDNTAWVSLAATRYSWEENQRPALHITVNEEHSAFNWRYMLQQFKTTSQSEHAELAVFQGARLLFEYQVSPREKGVSAQAVVNALKIQLINAGVPARDLD
jgi:hypothetical protein